MLKKKESVLGVSILLLVGLTFVPAGNSADLILNFDGGYGEIAEDSSGNGLDAEIHGAKWVESKFGKGLEFDGKDDYVKRMFPGSKEEFQDYGCDAYTVEAWINPGEDFSDGEYCVVGGYAWV